MLKAGVISKACRETQLIFLFLCSAVGRVGQIPASTHPSLLQLSLCFHCSLCKNIARTVLFQVWDRCQRDKKSTAQTGLAVKSNKTVVFPLKQIFVSVQERRGAVGAGPEEGHKNEQRAGTPPM